MSWGTVTVGRLTLRETFTLKSAMHQSRGTRNLTITGEESMPPLTMDQLRQRQEDILGLKDTMVPMTWADKSDHNGFYMIVDADTDLTNFNGEVAKFKWSIQATRIGPANGIDIESRLTGTTRANDFSLTGEKWHAPAIEHYGYYTGTTQPAGAVVRAGSDGDITVYRGVPAAVNPRWGSSEADYLGGRVRILVNDTERTGVNISVPGSGWDLNNGLVNVSPGASGTLNVSAYASGGWHDVEWNLTRGATAGSPLRNFDSFTVLRNDFEVCTIRCLKSRTPGRTILDLTLRRGSRFVEGYLQTDASTTLAAATNVSTNSTNVASGGYIVGTDGDPKFTAGSARNFTVGGSGNFYKTATTFLDFYLGAVVGSDTGDVATALRDQYLGAMAETTMAVRR